MKNYNVTMHQQRKDSGRIDILVSMGLFIGSTLILLFGASTVSHLAEIHLLNIPLPIGESNFHIMEGKTTVGDMHLFVEQTTSLTISGDGHLQLQDTNLPFTAHAQFNLLGQLQSASLTFQTTELSLEGIYPVRIETKVSRADIQQSSSATGLESIHCRYTTGSFSCTQTPTIQKIYKLLELYSVHFIEKTTVPLQHSSITVSLLHKELLSLPRLIQEAPGD